MASPHASYPNPGPSSYYHSLPPPPQLSYGNGLGPASYYQYSVPPVNGHAPVHHPSSQRVNPANRGRFNSHRGGIPNFQPYPNMPPPHTVHSPAVMQSPPISPVSPYIHTQSQSPHMPHIPYSPPYPPPPQPNGSYAPAWSAPLLSPLQKQLSMLPPVPPPAPASSSPQTQQEPRPVVPSFSNPTEISPSPSLSQSLALGSDPSHTQDEESQTSSHHPHESAQSSHYPSKSATELSSWVIWSRRPGDPSLAPGVIISTGAYPPEAVVHKALDLPTPPASPKLKAVEHSHVALDDFTAFDGASPDVAEVPSSSATETTPTSSTPGETPVPGSPASSHTSISLPVASSSVDGAKGLASPKLKEVAPDIAALSIDQPAATPSAESVPATGASEAAPPSSPPSSEPKPPAPRKSWASLLQSSDGAASSSKSRLPVSSVVGFSIPATDAGTAPKGADSPAIPHRNELLKLLSNGPTATNAPLKIQPRGLINTGNMCFANAVLQILVYCPPFNKLLTELSKYLAGPVVGSQKEGTKATPLIDATIAFIKEFVPQTSSDSKAKGKEREDDFYEPEAFIPSYVYDAMKEKKRFANMIGGHQEDAEEFLGFFLDTLEEELLSLSSSLSAPKPQASAPVQEKEAETKDDGWYEVGKKNRAVVTRTIKSTDSPITRIFGGKFRSTLRAPHQKDSVTVEDWRSLRLDIQREQVHSIKDALQYISHPQPVQISQPTRPGVVVEATQQDLIEALPPVLILHLKRFLYDTNVGDVVKISKQVEFGPDLDISPDLIAPTRRTVHPVKYQLFGVLYHHGQSASGGHYTLDVLHPNRDLSDRPRQAWIRIDDELVSDIRPDDVFGGFDRDDRCAYLLFYRRLGGWGPART